MILSMIFGSSIKEMILIWPPHEGQQIREIHKLNEQAPLPPLTLISPCVFSLINMLPII